MELQIHFKQLNTPRSWDSPLAVIAHIDLDAFYAQCQAISLGIDPNEPVVCRQWNSVIAVNYPARKFGIKRGMRIDEVKNLCQSINAPHVPTYKMGEVNWEVINEPDQNSYKTSLDLFRRESQKIFNVLKTYKLPVEKAGIDEGFIDLGPMVYQKAIERFPMLASKLPPKENEPLPAIPLNYKPRISGIVAKDENPVVASWHDVFIYIGGEIVDDIRKTVYNELKYTCSAGVSSTKLVAKLGSASNKPNNQTLVPKSFLLPFLDTIDLQTLWGWGGKYGAEVIENLDVPEINQLPYIRKFTLSQLESRLGDAKMARHLYTSVRGTYTTEFVPRTLTKSLVAVKQFVKPYNAHHDILKWTKTHSADLASRLLDMDQSYNGKFRPKVLGVKYSNPYQAMKSKQQQFYGVGSTKEALTEEIYVAACRILDQLDVLPCSALAVEVSQIVQLPKEQLNFSEKLVVEQSFTCTKCGRRILETLKDEHSDWHFATELQYGDSKLLAAKSALISKNSSKAAKNSSKSANSSKSKQGSIRDFFK